METQFCNSRHGYQIPFLSTWQGEKQVVLICHGFGSSKESSTGLGLMKVLATKGIGAIAFDFPAHGESTLDGESLLVENCLDDVADMEKWVLDQSPSTTISYFGSSFGAYIVLLYLTTVPAGRKACLRSAAVEMPRLFAEELTPDRQGLLDQQGYFLLEEAGSILKITTGFIRSLNAHNLYAYYRPNQADLLMLHGEADAVAPLADAVHFADYAGAKLYVFPGGEHRLMAPGQPEIVCEQAVAFFSAKETK